MPGLTAKQQRFVEEYLIDLNATQAAIRAGYSEKTAKQIGSRLLTNVDVEEAIAEGRASLSERTEITQDYVLSTIQSTVERCRQAEPVFYKSGERVMCETEDGEMVPAFTFQANAALKGCELLGKHLGMFTERVEHGGNVNFTKIERLILGEEDTEARPNGKANGHAHNTDA